MFKDEKLRQIATRRKEWEEGTLKASTEGLKLKESPYKFYTPLDISNHDFLEDVGFPGEYPFVASPYANSIVEARAKKIVWNKYYSGYGTPEDSRDYYKEMYDKGWQDGVYILLDIPTQCGYDSDDPISKGEVGKAGVAIDTLRDMEVIYEPFVGRDDLDKIQTEYVVNATSIVIAAMYIALAQKRGISLDRLRVGVQSDILSEFSARNLYTFPPDPSMRLVRDLMAYFIEYLPLSVPLNIAGNRIRESFMPEGSALGYVMSCVIAYVQMLKDAGLGVDEFGPRISFLHFGGGVHFFQQIAIQRAARRIWAKIMRERFGAKDWRSWQYRSYWGSMASFPSTTKQRPLNNLARAIIGGVASLLSGGQATVRPDFDEPLGLGHSLEARQLRRDAERILLEEAKIGEVIDPLAGSYYVEYLTNEVEAEAWEIIRKIDDLGGAVAAIKTGYIQQKVDEAAFEYDRKLRSGEITVVGVNKYTGENEMDVRINRQVPHPYDRKKRAQAEAKQITNLTRVKRERDNQKVQLALKELKDAGKDEGINLMPPILEAVKSYASLGEICGALKEVFGEAKEIML